MLELQSELEAQHLYSRSLTLIMTVLLTEIKILHFKLLVCWHVNCRMFHFTCTFVNCDIKKNNNAYSVFALQACLCSAPESTPDWRELPDFHTPPGDTDMEEAYTTRKQNAA